MPAASDHGESSLRVCREPPIKLLAGPFANECTQYFDHGLVILRRIARDPLKRVDTANANIGLTTAELIDCAREPFGHLTLAAQTERTRRVDGTDAANNAHEEREHRGSCLRNRVGSLFGTESIRRSEPLRREMKRDRADGDQCSERDDRGGER